MFPLESQLKEQRSQFHQSYGAFCECPLKKIVNRAKDNAIGESYVDYLTWLLKEGKIIQYYKSVAYTGILISGYFYVSMSASPRGDRAGSTAVTPESPFASAQAPQGRYRPRIFSMTRFRAGSMPAGLQI
jgi:hypothetical protein